MFKKWELIEKEKRMVCERFNPFFGYSSYLVYVDIYRKKKFNGTYKYKKVIVY